MDESELKKMLAVREAAERADAGANVARIEAGIAEREAQARTDRPGPESPEAGGSETEV
jgi:hypothetical protein